MARIINQVGLTKPMIRRKKYGAVNNHAYKRSKKTHIIFMDKNLIINSNFIGSQQTHRKKSLHQIDLQETIVLRIKKREEAI